MTYIKCLVIIKGIYLEVYEIDKTRYYLKSNDYFYNC